METLATFTAHIPRFPDLQSLDDVVVCEVEAVRAIRSGEKTVTCLPVEPQPDRRADWGHCGLDDVFRFGTEAGEVAEFGSRRCPYGRAGGTVRFAEPWAPFPNVSGFVYAADGFSDVPEGGWRSGARMPDEAMRLSVSLWDVRVRRLQELGEHECREQGFDRLKWFPLAWEEAYKRPIPVRRDGRVVGYVSYPYAGVDERRTFRGLPWRVLGNPWVWVLEHPFVG